MSRAMFSAPDQLRRAKPVLRSPVIGARGPAVELGRRLLANETLVNTYARQYNANNQANNLADTEPFRANTNNVNQQ